MASTEMTNKASDVAMSYEIIPSKQAKEGNFDRKFFELAALHGQTPRKAVRFGCFYTIILVS